MTGVICHLGREHAPLAPPSSSQMDVAGQRSDGLRCRPDGAASRHRISKVSSMHLPLLVVTTDVFICGANGEMANVERTFVHY